MLEIQIFSFESAESPIRKIGSSAKIGRSTTIEKREVQGLISVLEVHMLNFGKYTNP
jgi:hypothetical protein